MHGVEAKAKTLGLETTTILDEDYDHSKREPARLLGSVLTYQVFWREQPVSG